MEKPEEICSLDTFFVFGKFLFNVELPEFCMCYGVNCAPIPNSYVEILTSSFSE